MRVVKKEGGTPYEAKGHMGCWAVRKIESTKESRRLTVSLSHFLPQGGAEMSSSPKERAYFILSGSMLVKSKTEDHRLSQGDLIYIAPGEEREIQVVGTEPVTSLVIIVDTD